MLCSNPVNVGWKTQPLKRAPNRLPISCPMGTFPYFRVAICTRKFNNIRECSVTHNPKVVGSNPTPATNYPKGQPQITPNNNASKTAEGFSGASAGSFAWLCAPQCLPDDFGVGFPLGFH